MRIEKINELIKQELAKILLENVEFEPGVIVTVLDAEVSDSLETANVWISVFPENKSEAVLGNLNAGIGKIQNLLNKKIVRKFVPKITFKIDKSATYASNLETFFRRIKKDIDKDS